VIRFDSQTEVALGFSSVLLLLGVLSEVADHGANVVAIQSLVLSCSCLIGAQCSLSYP